MAYWKNRQPTWAEISKAIENLYAALPRVATLIYSDPFEVFWTSLENWEIVRNQWAKEFFLLADGQYVSIYYYNNGIAIAFHRKYNQDPPTISPTHIRLPKLSQLITLSPEDFFLLLQIIHTAKRTPAPSLSFAPNLPAVGYHSFDELPTLRPFFRLLKTNYRMADELCDKKWTSFADIANLVHLPPTAENQLAAMQYLTAIQNPDLQYFPIAAALVLELPEIDEFGDSDYCVPPPPSTVMPNLNIRLPAVYSTSRARFNGDFGPDPRFGRGATND